MSKASNPEDLYCKEEIHCHHPRNLTYYLKCCFGGVLACGITHTGICPVDVVKCKKQVNPTFARGTIAGLKKT